MELINTEIIYDNKNMPKMKLAHGYFPIQHLNEVCFSKISLENGTIFPELDMPFNKEFEYFKEE